jgi:hypothetical protein
MSILKECLSKDGIPIKYHRISKMDIVGTDRLRVSILSWLTQDAYLANEKHLTLTVEELVLDETAYTMLESLAMTSNLLSGGLSLGLDEQTLEATKRKKIFLLKSARNAIVEDGFVWDGSKFDSDLISRTNILGAYVASLTSTADTAWRVADNTWRILSTSDMAAVWNALQTHVATQFTIFASKEILVKNATTVEEINLIKW